MVKKKIFLPRNIRYIFVMFFHRIMIEFIKLLILVIFTFTLMYLVPGDIAELQTGLSLNHTTNHEILASFHLNVSFIEQLWSYLKNLLRGDLGFSYMTHLPVNQLILSALPVTICLACLTFIFSLSLGIFFGVIANFKKRSLWILFIDFMSSLLLMLPSFMIGIFLIYYFVIKFNFFPLFGKLTIFHFILPSLTIGLTSSALIYKMTKLSVSQTLQKSFVQNIQKQLISRFRFYTQYVLKNSMTPIIQLGSLELISLIGGSFITETLFGLPGIGKLLVSGITQKDTPVVLGVILVIACLISVIHLITESIHQKLNPLKRVHSA